MNISLKSDLWNEKSILSGKIQFDIRIQKKTFIESKIYMVIPELNIKMYSNPIIGGNQSIMDYLSNITELEFTNESGDTKYICEVDYYIMDKDPLSNISPGLSFCISFYK